MCNLTYKSAYICLRNKKKDIVQSQLALNSLILKCETALKLGGFIYSIFIKKLVVCI